MAGDTTRKRRLSGSASGNTTEQNKRMKRGDPQAYPSQSSPKDLEEWVHDSIKPEERDKRCQHGQAKANDGAGNNLSSVDLAGVASPDYIYTFDNDSDDRTAPNADLGVAETTEEPTPTFSVEPASSSKTTADSARPKQSKTKAAVRKAPAPENRADARQRMKEKAAKIKAAIASTDLSESQDKIEAAAKAEPRQYDSDDVISDDDPYSKLGCERRMVFTSDPGPEHQQYVSFQDGSNTDKAYPNAADKFFTWCQTRPTSNNKVKEDWDEAGYKDGRKARHFNLKMGPPHGTYGRPSRLAPRLKAIWSPLLSKRLRSSHVTIETEIPTNFAGTNYYKEYMDQILDLTGSDKLGERLTVKLAAGLTAALEHADPVAFYNPPIDIEVAWQKIREGLTYDSDVLALVVPGWNLGKGIVQAVPVPSLEQKVRAKEIFIERKELQMLEQKKQAHAGIQMAKDFIQNIRKFERSKELARGGSAEEPLVVEDLTTAKVSDHDATLSISDPLQTPVSSHNPKVHKSGPSVSSHRTTGPHPEFMQLVQSESTTVQAALADDAAGVYHQQWTSAKHDGSSRTLADHNQVLTSQQNALDTPNAFGSTQTQHDHHQVPCDGASEFPASLHSGGSTINLDYFDLSVSTFTAGGGAVATAINTPSPISITDSEGLPEINGMKQKKPFNKVAQMTNAAPVSPFLPTSPKRKRGDEDEEVASQPQPKVRRKSE